MIGRLMEWRGADPFRRWLVTTAGSGSASYECSLQWRIGPYRSGGVTEFGPTPDEAVSKALAEYTRQTEADPE